MYNVYNDFVSFQDGVELPKQIGFDIEDEQAANVPTPKASFLSNAAGADIVRQFLEQYFIIYDSDNRQPLLEAYHEHSTFSLTCTFTQNPQHKWVFSLVVHDSMFKFFNSRDSNFAFVFGSLD